MIALVYDTETTGLPDWSQPSESPQQPHIVQLGARLFDLDKRKSIATLDVIVRPNGWTIPAEVSAIHGITTEQAMDVGVPEHAAVGMLMDLWDGSRELLGHNESFDRRIVRIAQHRFPDRFAPALLDNWKAAKASCTQILATPILKLPPTERMKAAKRMHHKSANLSEAFEFFTGKPLEGAHSALVDVDACITVYLAIQDGVTERFGSTEAVAA